jgi:hypothetical protein
MVYEDFTTYVEVEPDNRIQASAAHIDALLYRNEDAYLYKDFGAGHFTDFEHLIDVYVAASTTYGRGYVLVLSEDTLDDFRGLDDNNKTAIGIGFIYFGYTAGVYPTIGLAEVYQGSYYHDYFADQSLNTWYYFRLKKAGTTLTLRLWTNATDRDNNDTGAGSYLGEKGLTLHANHSFRYLLVVDSYNDGEPNQTITFDVENLDLQEAPSIVPKKIVLKLGDATGIALNDISKKERVIII